MEKFNGFPPGKIKTTRIPNQFFSELMPEIDDLDELKLTLYVFWALQQQEGEYRYLSGSEILQDELFLKAMGGSSDSPEEKVQKALECAVSRGTLLHVRVEGLRGIENIYFLNTTRGRNAVRAIEAGQFHPGDRDTPIMLIKERPNIFTLYEQNIGALTPMISDELRAAEEEYPDTWIEEAIKLAVERNARNWRYVQSILKRWQAEGKDSGITKRPTQADRYRYIKGDYSDTIDY